MSQRWDTPAADHPDAVLRRCELRARSTGRAGGRVLLLCTAAFEEVSAAQLQQWRAAACSASPPAASATVNHEGLADAVADEPSTWTAPTPASQCEPVPATPTPAQLPPSLPDSLGAARPLLAPPHRRPDAFHAAGAMEPLSLDAIARLGPTDPVPSLRAVVVRVVLGHGERAGHTAAPLGCPAGVARRAAVRVVLAQPDCHTLAELDVGGMELPTQHPLALMGRCVELEHVRVAACADIAAAPPFAKRLAVDILAGDAEQWSAAAKYAVLRPDPDCRLRVQAAAAPAQLRALAAKCSLALLPLCDVATAAASDRPLSPPRVSVAGQLLGVRMVRASARASPLPRRAGATPYRMRHTAAPVAVCYLADSSLRGGADALAPVRLHAALISDLALALQLRCLQLHSAASGSAPVLVLVDALALPLHMQAARAAFGLACDPDEPVLVLDSTSCLLHLQPGAPEAHLALPPPSGTTAAPAAADDSGLRISIPAGVFGVGVRAGFVAQAAICQALPTLDGAGSAAPEHAGLPRACTAHCDALLLAASHALPALRLPHAPLAAVASGKPGSQWSHLPLCFVDGVVEEVRDASLDAVHPTPALAASTPSLGHALAAVCCCARCLGPVTRLTLPPTLAGLASPAVANEAAHFLCPRCDAMVSVRRIAHAVLRMRDADGAEALVGLDIELSLHLLGEVRGSLHLVAAKLPLMIGALLAAGALFTHARASGPHPGPPCQTCLRSNA